MIAFDSNHLLRHILQDDPKQCEHVNTLLLEKSRAGHRVMILDLAILESCCVLKKVYEFDSAEWCHVLKSLLSDSAFTFENVSKLQRVLDLYERGGADFNDYLILEQARCTGAEVETFDKKLKSAL